MVVMTVLHGNGGLPFAAACKVLIYVLIELYSNWATLARIVPPLSRMSAEQVFAVQNQIKTMV